MPARLPTAARKASLAACGEVTAAADWRAAQRDTGVTQECIAAVLGVRQDVVSDLIANGRIGTFARLDALLADPATRDCVLAWHRRQLERAGFQVKVAQHATGNAFERVSVLTKQAGEAQACVLGANADGHEDARDLADIERECTEAADSFQREAARARAKRMGMAG